MSDGDRKSDQSTSRRRRRRGRSTRRDYEITCHRCGARDTVPFKPKPGRELVCAKCLEKQGRGEREGAVRRDGDRAERSLYDVTCSHCGELDQVPFKPRRGGAVLCARCMADPRVVRVGGRVFHEIICASCGNHDQVPFRPDSGSRVLCGSCHRSEREARGVSRDRFWLRHPGEVSGVRIKIEVRCDDCGSIDNLNFAPGPGETVLCRTCAEKRFGESWSLRRRMSAATHRPTSCSVCGHVDFVPATHGPVAGAPMCRRCEVDLGLASDEHCAASELRDFWLTVEP